MKYLNKRIYSWCENIEQTAMDQIIDLANHPAISNHIAIMPDCHAGAGVPIGSVIACKNAVIPNAVGVDIGCGMRAMKTNIFAGDLNKKDLKYLFKRLKEEIPVGFAHRERASKLPEILKNSIPKDSEIIQQEIENAKKQLGTLGGGNHFIEIQKDEKGYVWIMVHSGSRNFGYKIAQHYNKLALEYDEKNGLEIPNKNLAYFPFDEELGVKYLLDMKYAMLFAKENRKEIIDIVFNSCLAELFPAYGMLAEIDIHHNYACIEQHFGQVLVVHRKGATLATEGKIGIIPGSMGTSSYIVQGKGNADSYCSCSHGAGRVMGRMEASRTLSRDSCDESMKHVVFDGWGKNRKGNVDLGEAPAAYKNIDEVMEHQKDLVEIVHTLKPLCVVKG